MPWFQRISAADADVCVEMRSYGFAEPAEAMEVRVGINVDSGERQDFGPTVMVEAAGTAP